MVDTGVRVGFNSIRASLAGTQQRSGSFWKQPAGLNQPSEGLADASEDGDTWPGEWTGTFFGERRGWCDLSHCQWTVRWLTSLMLLHVIVIAVASFTPASDRRRFLVPPSFRLSFGMGEPTAAVDYEYRKILVIGAKKTGKTSILSTAVGGDFSRNYRPTARCGSYYDVQNMLELIDTPGLDDTLLNGTKDTEEPVDFEGVRQHYLNFRDDPIVQEMLTEPREKDFKDNLLIDVDITQVDAYLIVYTDDERSKRLAKALRLAILTKRMNDNRRAIFMLYHQGDFDSQPFVTRVTINDDTRQMDEEKNDPFVELVFRDDVLIQTKAYHHPSLKYLPNCSAQTGESLYRTLGVLRQELDRMGGGNSVSGGGAGGKDSSAAGGSKRKGPKVPHDLFALTGGDGSASQVSASRSAAKAGGGGAGGASDQKAAFSGKRGFGAKKKQQDQDEAADEDDGAPVNTKGQQRAQCSSMAAAACTIQ